MLARTHLIKIQKNLYDRLKAQSRNSLGELPPELKQYILEYQRDFYREAKISLESEFLFSIRQSKIVLCGDYHTLHQSQRYTKGLIEKVLPYYKKNKLKLILALEMFQPKDNISIKKYIQGECTESEFLQSVGLDKKWGFYWENYKIFFELCKNSDVEIIGINYIREQKLGTLKERDGFAAKQILKFSKENNNRVWVVIGDLHLASEHLPRQIERELEKQDSKKTVTIIHQNNEHYYWKYFGKKSIDNTQIYKMQKHVFCVLNTAPWLKIQSHLKWLEYQQESSDSNLSIQKISEVFKSVDYHEDVIELVESILHFIGEKQTSFEDFQVYGPHTLHLIKNLTEEGFYTKKEVEILKACIKEFQSFFVPKKNILYLTNLSLNQAATQVGAFVFSKLSGYKKILKKPNEDFMARIWFEAISYLGSKIINPKRNCFTPVSLKKFLAKEAKRDEFSPNKKIAEWVLSFWNNEDEIHFLKEVEKSLPKESNIENLLFYYKVAKIIGYYFGERIYFYMVGSGLNSKHIRKLYMIDLTNSGYLLQNYYRWVLKLKKK